MQFYRFKGNKAECINGNNGKKMIISNIDEIQRISDFRNNSCKTARSKDQEAGIHMR